ncbi:MULTISPECIES: hypothetical protein [Leifsonia]|uniref:hypothetical protein n=1 Tax=Leifsonia TaxID=110932 RepID=UPI0028ACD967|nr:hypothetical protein [Leifsonia aquatica]
MTRQRTSTRDTSMTAEEAAAITRQYDSCRLDDSLPGTRELIDHARKVELRQYMWGTSDHPAGRRLTRTVIALGCGCLAATIGGLTLVFVTSR